MSLLFSQISTDLKSAMLARSTVRVSVLRMLLSSLNYKKIELQRELSDDDVVKVVAREIKQREESIVAYRPTRPDLADREEEEKIILTSYQPVQLSDEELEAIVDEVAKEMSIKDMSGMGKMISKVKEKTGDSADGARIAVLVKKILGQTG